MAPQHKDPVARANSLRQNSGGEETEEENTYTDTDTGPHSVHFALSDTIDLLKKRNYKDQIPWVVQMHDKYPITAVLDTGAGPKLVNKDALPK